jgi:hypothetical protein
MAYQYTSRMECPRWDKSQDFKVLVIASTSIGYYLREEKLNPNMRLEDAFLTLFPHKSSVLSRFVIVDSETDEVVNGTAPIKICVGKVYRIFDPPESFHLDVKEKVYSSS